MQGDFLTAIKVLLLFLPVFCFGQTGASQVFTRQSGTGAVLRSVESKLDEGPSVVDFGADPTGVADSAAAFTACGAAGLRCYVPHGIYKTLSPPQLLTPNSVLICADRLTEIWYKGGATLNGFQVGDGTPNTNNVTIEKCDFRANSNVTGAALELNNVSGAVLREVRTGDAPYALSIYNSNTVLVDSGSCAGTSVTPIECIRLSGKPGTGFATNGVVIQNFDVSGLSSIGLHIKNTGTMFSEGINFSTYVIGGTFGQGLPCVVEDQFTQQTRIEGLDCENGTGVSLQMGGQESYIGGPNYLTGSVHYTSTAVYPQMIASQAEHVTIDAGATGVLIKDNLFGPASGIGIVNAEPSTQFSGNIISGHASEDYIGGNYVGIIGGKKGFVNYVVDTGANNAIVGTFLYKGTEGIATDITTTPPALYDGMPITVLLNHTLQAGANTFNFAGNGAVVIKYAPNGSTIPTAFSVLGNYITLRWSATCTCWLSGGG